MEYKFISTDEDAYKEERALRAKVLREPLGFPAGAEVFPFEYEAMHLVALDGERVVGCCMFKPEGKGGRLLQMAVYFDHQKRGIGGGMIKCMEARLKELGFEEIYLHSREDAVDFYKRFGFEPVGKKFIEIGINHQKMVKRI